MVRLVAILLAVWWFLLLGYLLPRKSPVMMVRSSRDAEWDHKRVWRIFPIALTANIAFMPGCNAIPAMRAGLIVGGILQILFIARLVAARVRHEKGVGWLFYAVLIWMSPFWIPVVVNTRYILMK